MKLKRYNDFSINESFGISKDYQDFLTSKSISLDTFNDSLFDVKEFASARTYRYLVDSKLKAVNAEVDDNETYRMLYNCLIQYNIKSGKNDFSKVIDNLNTINISIDEMISRAESKGLELKDNTYIVTSLSVGHPESVDNTKESINHKFFITFLSDEINTKELKDIYNKYISTKDKEYLEGLEKLRNIYRKEGIDFDKYMDTTDDEEGYILIGVFISEDLYGVASYDTETKKFIIDRQEINDSVNAYREDNG
jgi:hypothetical protein